MIATQYSNSSANLPLSVLDMSLTIPLVEAHFLPNGRQAAFRETVKHRQARQRFTTKSILDSIESRTGSWVNTQAIASSSHPSAHATGKRSSHGRSSPTSYSPPSTPACELLYAIPEDSDAPACYQEPHIFYSTGPQHAAVDSPYDPKSINHLLLSSFIEPVKSRKGFGHRRSSSSSPNSSLSSIPEIEE